MRPITGPERALLGGDHDEYARLKVANSGGSLVDYSAFLADDWSVTADLDNKVAQATFPLIRESDGITLAPLHGSSGNAIDVNRLVTFETAITAKGVAPVAGDWKEIFSGYIDTVDSGRSPMTLQCRDRGKSTLDAFIEVPGLRYGNDTTPVAVETVSQQLINDHVLTAPPALVLGPTGSPAWFLEEFTQAQVNVFEAVLALWLQIGWDLRYRYGSSSTPQLTAYEPDRAATVPVDVFLPSEYTDIPSLPLDDDQIRNYIEVFYVDGTTGTVSTATAFDPTSITKFGRRYMLLAVDATKNIKTAIEAQRMADAALADLAYPRASQTTDLCYAWHLELADFIGWAANNVHYDSQQNFGVAAITHSGRGGRFSTTVRASGKPAGAYAAWIRAGQASLAGLVPGLPEILFVSAPIPIIGTGGVVTGYRFAGRVDTDTRALIVVLSTGITMKSSTPAFVDVVNGAVTEQWLSMPPAGFFTIEVELAVGGTGTATLTPASVYNPLATIPPPRGGTLGPSFIQRFNRAPVTSIHVESPTLTTRRITLTVRPATATTRYRFAPLPAGPSADPWVVVPPTAGGSVTFGIDISQADVQLQYFSTSVDQVAEEIHTINFDQNLVPQVTVTLAENLPNIITATIVLDDDCIAWRMWRKRGLPKLHIQSGGGIKLLNPAYLIAAGNRQETEVTFFCEGAGDTTFPNVPDNVTVVVVGYDKHGTPSAEAQAFLVVQGTAGTPPTAGALSELASGPEPGNFLGVTWSHNDIVEAAAGSQFTVRILENGIEVVALAAARQAKTESDGTDTLPNFGGWRRSITSAADGDPGATYLTFRYDVWLYDTGVFVASYSVTHSGFFIATTVEAQPTGTPPAATLTLVPTGCVDASWGAPGASYPIQIEWHQSTDNFVANDTVMQDHILDPGTASETACGFSPTLWVRERRRYVNSAGVGSWTSYSTSVQIAAGILP